MAKFVGKIIAAAALMAISAPADGQPTVRLLCSGKLENVTIYKSGKFGRSSQDLTLGVSVDFDHALITVDGLLGRLTAQCSRPMEAAIRNDTITAGLKVPQDNNGYSHEVVIQIDRMTGRLFSTVIVLASEKSKAIWNTATFQSGLRCDSSTERRF